MLVNQKQFENPETGKFLGTIVDVVDVGKVKDKFGAEKIKVDIFWVLNANDSEGKPFRVMWRVNAVMADRPKKSNLYMIAEGVLGTAPPAVFDTEGLIGRSNELVIVKETNGGKTYANIKAIMPLPAGAVPPPIPQGFVRAKDRQANTYQSAAPAVAVAQPAAQPVANSNPAPGPAQPKVDAAF